MKEWRTDTWLILVGMAIILSGLVFGWVGWEFGRGEGHAQGYQEATVQKDLIYPEVTWGEEWSADEPAWEDTLYQVLEEIDTANITIHVEDRTGVTADIHISWRK